MLDRRNFIKSMTIAGAGLGLTRHKSYAKASRSQEPIPVGMIGLDTSHCPAFTKLINYPESEEFSGFKVVAAYPYGSRTIESSYSRIPRYIEEVKEMGVEITDSIAELLNRVDVVLLETNDGNPRLKQSLQVIRAGKTVFLDKPIAASLEDVISIMEASKEYNVPIFSSSRFRYIHPAQAIRYENRIGTVMGASTYSAAPRDETHPDLYWYGIHSVEGLFSVMGPGCRSVTRFETDNADVVTGIWEDGRIGTIRGIREGRRGAGGTVFGSDRIETLEDLERYETLMVNILEFFRTGISPVKMEETLEIYAFMEAADESKRQGGAPVTLDYVISKARKT